MKQVITPLFTSKAQYAIEIFTDPTSSFDSSHLKDSSLTRLQVLQNKAMRAALRKPPLDQTNEKVLLLETGQPSMIEVSLRATGRAAAEHLNPRNISSIFGDRIVAPQSVKHTRSWIKGTLPPQNSRGTLISNMCRLWNALPQDLKMIEDVKTIKRKVKQWCQNICDN
jgi:hypothetical protein